jgi:hypothetical protein
MQSSQIRSGMLSMIPDSGSGVFSIPDPGVKKASDSGSATLFVGYVFGSLDSDQHRDKKPEPDP